MANNMESSGIAWWLLLAALIAVAVLWNLYLQERRKTAKVRRKAKGTKAFHRAFEEEKSGFYIYIEKEERKIDYISPNFEKMTGLEEERLMADLEVLTELVSPQMRRKMQKEIDQWNKKGILKLETAYHRLHSETEKHARIRITETENGYLLSCMDMTEDYKAREQMKKELSDAQKESSAKTDFLSRMSHEIRTPMNGIMGMLSLAKAHIGETASLEEYLNKTESLSQFLLTLINDILDMSRIESGKMELEKVPFDLFALAENLDNMFRSTAESKGIRWSVELQDFDEHYVVGDEMRLSQVIINFISNANKFTPEGGSVTVTFRQMDKIDGKLHLMIRVRDTGKGIRRDFLDKIFRPFEQEDASTAHNYGGSGLGMAIADNIVKLMHGEILVESEEGKGSEFVVYVALPLAEKEQIKEQIKEQESQAQESANKPVALDDFTLDGIHILLAEDNDINAEVAVEILGMKGAIVQRACDGEEVVQMFKNSALHAYDVILMDIQMPKMDGWEATKVIRKMQREDSDILIFAMSANAFLEDRRHSIRVGMNGHINKPVDFDELRQMIGEQLCQR